MPTIPKEDLYAVLDLSSTATVEEIKRSYRKISRENHPDMTGQLPEQERAPKTARFNAAAIAYEWLSDTSKRSQYDASRYARPSTNGFDDFFGPSSNQGFDFEDIFRNFDFADFARRNAWREEPPRERVVVPEPETLTYKGVGMYVRYDFERSRFGDGYVTATVSIDIEDAKRLAEVYDYGDFYRTVDLHGAVLDHWSATVGGDEAFAFTGPSNFRHGYKLWQEQEAKKQQKRVFYAQLNDLSSRLERLRILGRPVDVADKLAVEADGLVYRFKEYRGSNFETVTAAIRALEKELDRISDGGPELLLNDLLEGRIYGEQMASNREVVDQVRMWSIRTDGFIDMLTHEDLHDIIAKRIAGAVSVEQLKDVDLAVKLEDYVLQEVIEELDHAPDTVEVQGRKTFATYEVVYGFVTIDGEEIPVGAITVPLSVYERNAVEYGKKSSFPDLGFGIKLLLHVLDDGKEIACGFDDMALAKRVTSYKKSKQRGKSRQADPLFGFNPLGYDMRVTPPPPWYKGKRVRV